MFFSHYHWDHVQGFPFFAPAFVPGNKLYLYGAIARDGSTLEQRLVLQMLHPNFPVPLQVMSSHLQFRDLTPGDRITLHPGIMLETTLLNHPGVMIGYRVNYQGRSVA